VKTGETFYGKWGEADETWLNALERLITLETVWGGGERRMGELGLRLSKDLLRLVPEMEGESREKWQMDRHRTGFQGISLVQERKRKESER